MSKMGIYRLFRGVQESSLSLIIAMRMGTSEAAIVEKGHFSSIMKGWERRRVEIGMMLKQQKRTKSKCFLLTGA